MSRTLVFSFDGTGNEPSDVGKFAEGESISNVLKLHILMGGGMEPSETNLANGETQKTHYYNGIGTRDGKLSYPLVGWIRSKINMAVAPSFGDARRILNEARGDFDEADFQVDDRIVVFGFSRGAALARKFVSELLEDEESCRIAFLGVYDTVVAMNGFHRRSEQISTDVLFENGTLHERVNRAVHLLALDEQRVAFAPTLINQDGGDRIEEVWMPGVHSDVGGGYWRDGLSDSTLDFMIGRCQTALDGNISIAPGDDIVQIQNLIETRGRQLACLTADDVAVHPMHNGVLHANESSLTGRVVGLEPRDVCVHRNDRPIPGTPPLVHDSVRVRFETVPGYRPVALRGVRFRLLQANGATNNNIDGRASRTCARYRRNRFFSDRRDRVPESRRQRHGGYHSG